MTWMNQLIVAPILLPLLTAGLMLMLGEKRRPLKAQINLCSSIVGLGVAVLLLYWTQQGGPGSIGVYLPGNWQVPFGIVLVVDQLSAMMLVLTGVIGVSALLFAMARWDRAGTSFHALFQIQLMGLYGAFLTADLFNLFVFFEVLLAASYGLMLHGSGRARVSSGLHYIAINLLASSLFLIGAAMIYGVTGTLNFADLALKIPLVPEADRGLLHAGAAILATAFLAKAGMWPLNFWLAPAYSSASAPVAAMFAIMTKVGVYTVLRLWTLLFSGQAGASALFGGDWLVYGGMATIICAALAMVAAQRLERMASLSILVSAGILLSAVGFAQPSLTAGALFYLVSSTLALSALFLLAELIERSRSANDLPLDEEIDALPKAMESLHPRPGVNLDDEQKAVIGQVIPWTMAFLGLSLGEHDRVQRMRANLIARRQHLVQVIAADDMPQQHHPRQQAQTACASDHQRHIRPASRIGTVVPIADQQERKQAGQFPEEYDLDQVAGDHQAKHGAHERQEKRKETRHRVVR